MDNQETRTKDTERRKDSPSRNNYTGNSPNLEIIWTLSCSDVGLPGESGPEAIKFRLDKLGMMRKDLDRCSAAAAREKPFYLQQRADGAL